MAERIDLATLSPDWCSYDTVADLIIIARAASAAGPWPLWTTVYAAGFETVGWRCVNCGQLSLTGGRDIEHGAGCAGLALARALAQALVTGGADE